MDEMKPDQPNTPKSNDRAEESELATPPCSEEIIRFSARATISFTIVNYTKAAKEARAAGIREGFVLRGGVLDYDFPNID